MKRILIITVLAALLISTVGVTAAAAEPNTKITRPIFMEKGDAENGVVLGPGLGIVTYDTATGGLTIKTYSPLLPSDEGGRYGIYVSSAAPEQGRVIPFGTQIIIGTVTAGSDGRINVPDGQIAPELVDTVNNYIANDGVFTLSPYGSG